MPEVAPRGGGGIAGQAACRWTKARRCGVADKRKPASQTNENPPKRAIDNANFSLFSSHWALGPVASPTGFEPVSPP